MKNDFSRREKEVNLSNSQLLKNTSGAELAYGDINQSKGSINFAGQGVSSPSHQAKFRIGNKPSPNVSREYSRDKQRDHTKSNSQLLRRNSRAEKSRGEKILATLNCSKGPLQRRPSRGGIFPPATQQKNNIIIDPQLAQIGTQMNRGEKDSPVHRFRPSSRQGPTDSSRGLGSRREDHHRLAQTLELQKGKSIPEQGSTTVEIQKEATVVWRDNLHGEDIRTELKFGDCLGQGSFAKVYDGFDKSLKRPVAIKVIDKRKIRDHEIKKKALIEEEVSIFSRMSHPNIVRFIRLLEDVKRVAQSNTDLHSYGIVWPSNPKYFCKRFRTQKIT